MDFEQFGTFNQLAVARQQLGANLASYIRSTRRIIDGLADYIESRGVAELVSLAATSGDEAKLRALWPHLQAMDLLRADPRNLPDLP